MTTRPMLFSAPMVRAILAGTKTQTRRAVKPMWGADHAQAWSHEAGVFQYGDNDGWHTCPAPRCRYGVPDDRLWVRESLTHITSDPVSAEPCDVHCYTASIPPGKNSANPYEPNYLFPDDGEPNLKPKNTPSIHMPRWASRITLELTGVRVERLNDISQDDAVAEGCDDTRDMVPRSGRVMWAGGPRVAYEHLWNEINGAGSWALNPWVWVLEFKRV